MEFRPIVRSVCRSAVAARPSLLAGTRLSPAAILLHHHNFTTSTQKPSEAAAAAPRQPQYHPPPVQQDQPAHGRVNRLRNSIPVSKPNYPPRPPPFTSNSFEGIKASPTQPGAKQPPASGSSKDPSDLYESMQLDMDKATGSMATWNDNDFVGKYYTSAPQTEVRLRPSTGRTVHVRGQVDVARAFRVLDKSVRQNGIKRQVQMSRSHERPALKRKREKRERWAARFKNGFRATIDRVMELKAQGW